MMRVAFNIVKSVFSLIFSIFRPLKRLWCRRLKTSERDPGVPTVVSTHSTAIDMTQSLNVGDQTDMEMEPWDAWDASQSQQSQSQLSQSSAAYYQQAGRPGSMISHSTNQHMRGRKLELEAEPEPEPDYFQDMTPDVKKPAKILIKKKENSYVNSSAIASRLSAVGDVPAVGSELQSWEEGENAWGEEATEDLSWEAEAALKEKRRLERQNRTLEQQRKKQQRDSMRGLKKDSHLAVKIS